MMRLLHKLAVAAISLATLCMYATFFFYRTNRLLLFGVAVIIAGLVSLLGKRMRVHDSFWRLYFFVEIGILGLFSVVEWNPSLYLVSSLGTIAAGILAIWGILAVSPTAFLREKPLRRVVVVFLAFSVFAYAATGQAVLSFFPTVPPFIVHGIIALFSSIGAYLAWSLYYDGQTLEFMIPAAVIGGLTFEISLVFSFLSIGYLASAFLISWLWYLAQLLIRFHFGRRDIVWSKQRWFLGMNALVMIVFVYSLRFL